MLRKFDIIGLGETHISDTYYANLEGYINIAQSSRCKLKTAKKGSGGVAALVKKSVHKGIAHIKSPHVKNDIIWLKLCKKFFNLDSDLYICIIYISPEYSSYSKRQDGDIFLNLEKDIAYFSLRGSVILTGDFNARTGLKIDFVNDVLSNHVPVPFDYPYDVTTCRRNNQDSSVNNCNNYGESLLKICREARMRILNGRTVGDVFGKLTCHTRMRNLNDPNVGDVFGKLTCHQYNGSSVVDYTIVNEGLLKHINYFRIHDWMESISDHCPMSLSIASHYQVKKDKTLPLRPALSVYRWDKESAFKFTEVLRGGGVKDDLLAISNSIHDHNVHHETLLSQFNSIIYKVADSCLRKRKRKPRKKSHRKWFDHSCKALKSKCATLAKLLLKQPFNRGLRSELFGVKKHYKYTLKKTKSKYKEDILDKIENMHDKNPKEYWKLVDQLKSEDNEGNQDHDKIDPTSWHEYFSKLLAPDTESDERSELINNKLKELEQNKCFNELNFRITETEVIKALRSLKNNKAAGLDGILNEMLKAGVSEFRSPLTVIFNKIFTIGQYPEIWSEGFISTIHKKGDPTKPENYRGITICSNLSKVYSTILNERLINFTQTHKIMRPEQIGFKRKARTSDHSYICA